VGKGQDENDLRLELASGAQGHEPSLCDDHVIEHAYAHELTNLHEAFGDCEILFAGLRIATRVIVYEYDARSRT
jgi:hypothetical protein